MDWYLDGRQTEAVSELRHEIDCYLRRHGSQEGDYDGATLAVGELLANAVQHAPGPVWVHLEWPEERPLFEVHDLGSGFSLENVSLPEDPSSSTGRGLFVAHQLVEDLQVAAKRAGGSRVSATLPVARPPQRSHEPLMLSSEPARCRSGCRTACRIASSYGSISGWRSEMWVRRSSVAADVASFRAALATSS